MKMLKNSEIQKLKSSDLIKFRLSGLIIPIFKKGLNPREKFNRLRETPILMLLNNFELAEDLRW